MKFVQAKKVFLLPCSSVIAHVHKHLCKYFRCHNSVIISVVLPGEIWKKASHALFYGSSLAFSIFKIQDCEET